MIVTLTGANFSKSNVGTLDFWAITRRLGRGAVYDGPITVERGASLRATISLNGDYSTTLSDIVITMGGQVIEGAVTETEAGKIYAIRIAEITGNITIVVPTINMNVNAHTITYKYMCGDVEIAPSATEKAVEGSMKEFSADKIPAAYGYVGTSVEPAGTYVIEEDMEVIYYYREAELEVSSETGTRSTTGYYNESVTINGFWEVMPVSVMPDKIDGVRIGLKGMADGDVKNITAFIGYVDAPTTTNPIIVKSVTVPVTLTTSYVVHDFLIDTSKEEILAAMGAAPVWVIGYQPTDTAQGEENYEYSIGCSKFTGTVSNNAIAQATPDYKCGYFYHNKWALNSSRQGMYFATLTYES